MVVYLSKMAATMVGFRPMYTSVDAILFFALCDVIPREM